MIKQLIERYRTWQRQQAAIYQLERMDPRELEDLGLRRCDIPFVVRHGVRDITDLRERWSHFGN